MAIQTPPEFSGGCFAAAARTEKGHELTVVDTQGRILECNELAGFLFSKRNAFFSVITFSP
jgi:hypothetical protein